MVYFHLCHVLFLSIVVLLDQWLVDLVEQNLHVENIHQYGPFHKMLVLNEDQLVQLYNVENTIFFYCQFIIFLLSFQTLYLIVKSLLSSLSFLSISSSSSSVLDRGSPCSSDFVINKSCRSVGMSCCLRKVWSSGCVMFNRLCPYKSALLKENQILTSDIKQFIIYLLWCWLTRMKQKCLLQKCFNIIIQSSQVETHFSSFLCFLSLVTVIIVGALI